MTQLDPFHDSVLDDPYPFYAHLREQMPCVHSPERDVWLVSRHADVVAVLRDPVSFSSSEGAGYVRVDDPERGGILISSDPPRHTRMRRIVQSAFSPHALEQIGRSVRERADRLVAQALAHGTVDAIRELAEPLPLAVASWLLGLPADEGTYAAWSDAVFRTMGPQSASEHAETGALLGGLIGFLLPVLQQRRFEADGLAARILGTVGEPGGLTEGEALSLVISIFAAGIDTTVQAFGNGLAAFAQHPAAWQRLHQEPALVAGAVEEILRYDAPIQAFFRTATRDAVVAGVSVPSGARVMALFGSANRDPARFAEPTELRIDRDASGQLAFGAGIHLCLGAPLARIELQALFGALAARVSTLRLAGPPIRRHRAVVRGLRSLPLELLT